jgi:adenylylsulfate kinase
MINSPLNDLVPKCLLIQGLPGSGKTTLARAIKEQIDAVHINADWARSTITSHLGFKHEDRIKQAQSLGQMARLIQDNGQWSIVDFVCPLPQTRAAFFDKFKKRSDVFSVWMGTIQEGRFEDTNKIYKAPSGDVVDYSIERYLGPNEFRMVAYDIVKKLTVGHRTYYIRYNTHSDGHRLMWRVIDALTLEETLCDSFDLKGHMEPAMTLEHGARKFNVGVTGYGTFVTDNDGMKIFVLKY